MGFLYTATSEIQCGVLMDQLEHNKALADNGDGFMGTNPLSAY
jgi:hypothetical protein